MHQDKDKITPRGGLMTATTTRKTGGIHVAGVLSSDFQCHVTLDKITVSSILQISIYISVK